MVSYAWGAAEILGGAFAPLCPPWIKPCMMEVMWLAPFRDFYFVCHSAKILKRLGELVLLDRGAKSLQVVLIYWEGGRGVEREGEREGVRERLKGYTSHLCLLN